MIECSRELLLAAISKSRKVCHHGTLPILGNVMLVADPINAWVTLTSTDLDAQLALDVEADVDEELTTCVDAERLYQALSVEGEKTKVTLDGEKLKIATGRSVFRLPRLDAKEFPLMRSPENATASFDCDWLGAAFLKALPFAGLDNDPRVHFRGISLRALDGVLTLSATNGAAAAQITRKIDESRQFEVMLPRRLCELLPELGAARAIIKDGSVLFLGENMQLVAKLLEAKLPDFEKVFVKPDAGHLNVDRKELESAVKACAPLSANKVVRSVGLRVADSVCHVEGLGMSGEAHFEIDAPDSSPLEIQVQDKFVLALLGCCDGEKAEIIFDSNEKLGVSVGELRAVAMGYRI